MTSYGFCRNSNSELSNLISFQHYQVLSLSDKQETLIVLLQVVFMFIIFVSIIRYTNLSILLLSYHQTNSYCLLNSSTLIHASMAIIPLASRSNVTSVWEHLLPAFPSNLKFLIHYYLLLMPFTIINLNRHWILIIFHILKMFEIFFVGIIVFSISFVMTHPAVPVLKIKVPHLKQNSSALKNHVEPDKIAAWTAAPYATASSGNI